MATATTAAQVLSISTALIASGGIAVLTLFDIPELQSQPASRSLPSTRWLFSRGSHIFPTASVASTAGFACLAYAARPTISLPIAQLLRHGKIPGYLIAAVLTFSIAPVTTQLMVPTNFKLIKMNEERGGTRSQKSAQEGGAKASNSADDSVGGKGQPGQYTDLSVPQTETQRSTTPAEDEEVRQLLGKFGQLNGVRAVLMAAGGVVGLMTALA